MIFGLKLQERRSIATERRTSRSTCHGLTRKNTEKTEAEAQALPRNDTGKHGNKQKQNKPRKEGKAEAEALATD